LQGRAATYLRRGGKFYKSSSIHLRIQDWNRKRQHVGGLMTHK